MSTRRGILRALILLPVLMVPAWNSLPQPPSTAALRRHGARECGRCEAGHEIAQPTAKCMGFGGHKRLRGGGDRMDFEGFGGAKARAVGDGWDILSEEDIFGVNVTMLQMTRHPYIAIELWWDSMGKFRCSYEDTAEDILCIFPQGAISTRSAWELDSLAAKLDKERGQHPLPRGNVSLGSWTLEPSERFVRVHNLHQEQNYLYLTEYGYVFADSLGRVFICRDNTEPVEVPREAAGALLGVDPEQWPQKPQLAPELIELWDEIKGPQVDPAEDECFPPEREDDEESSGGDGMPEERNWFSGGRGTRGADGGGERGNKRSEPDSTGESSGGVGSQVGDP